MGAPPTTGPASDAPGKFDAGPLVGIQAGVTEKFIRSHKVAIIRVGSKVFAESAICTHKACSLKVINAELRCPCHGSKFDNDGKPTKGPAKDGLSRYGVAVKDGHLIVDTNAIILPGDFEKDDAFVTVGDVHR